MELVPFEDAGALYRRAEPFLVVHEAEHNLLLGILTTLTKQPDASAPAPYLATIQDGGQVVAVALMTPPHNLVLSLMPEARAAGALALVAQDVYTRRCHIPGVLGPVPFSGMFAEQWRTTSGAPFSLAFHERVYRLEEVQPVAGVPGTMRRATEADRALLIRWMVEFTDEALGQGEPFNAEQWVDDAFASPLRGVYLWDDDQPVTLACYSGPTPHGMRIGPVYTPPEHRRRGYASACVAAISQWLLEHGWRFCFLFTNLSNPTANHIYQAIGYRPVCDVDVYAFAAPHTNEE
jgi:predicted GNAT family acetyltransferase